MSTLTARAQQVLDAYLAELALRLTDASAAEREEILGGVSEHVADAVAGLGRPAEPQELTAALASLGTVDQLAAAWAATRDEPAGRREGGVDAVAAGRTGDGEAMRSPGWEVVLAVVAGLVLGLMPVFGAVVGAVVLVLGLLSRRRHWWGYRQSAVAAVLGGVAVVVGLVVLLWLTPASGERIEPSAVPAQIVPTPTGTEG